MSAALIALIWPNTSSSCKVQDGPPDNFLVLLLHPSEVDYVELAHDIRYILCASFCPCWCWQECLRSAVIQGLHCRAKYFRLEDDQRQHEDPELAAQVAAAFSQKPNGQDKALLWRKQDVNP